MLLTRQAGVREAQEFIEKVQKDRTSFGTEAQVYWVSAKRMPRTHSLRAEVARPGASMSKMAICHS